MTTTSPSSKSEDEFLESVVTALDLNGWARAAEIMRACPDWPEVMVYCRLTSDAFEALSLPSTLVVTHKGEILYIGVRDPAGFVERECRHPAISLVRGPLIAFCAHCVLSNLTLLES